MLIGITVGIGTTSYESSIKLIKDVRKSETEKEAINNLAGYLLNESPKGNELLLKICKTKALLSSRIASSANNDKLLGGFSSIVALLISAFNLFVDKDTLPGFGYCVAAIFAVAVVIIVAMRAGYSTNKTAKLDYAHCWLNLICENAGHDAGKIEAILRGELKR